MELLLVPADHGAQDIRASGLDDEHTGKAGGEGRGPQLPAEMVDPGLLLGRFGVERAVLQGKIVRLEAAPGGVRVRRFGRSLCKLVQNGQGNGGIIAFQFCGQQGFQLLGGAFAIVGDRLIVHRDHIPSMDNM